MAHLTMVHKKILEMLNNCLKKGPILFLIQHILKKWNPWVLKPKLFGLFKTQNWIGNGSLKPEPAGISKIKYPLIISKQVVLSNYLKNRNRDPVIRAVLRVS
jgi:hypothetical protein